MATRKYWVGTSDKDDHAPCDFITFIAESDEDVDEAMELVRDYFKQDLTETEEMEGISDASNL